MIGCKRLILASFLIFTTFSPSGVCAAQRHEPGWQVMVQVVGQGRVKGYMTRNRIMMDTGVFRSYLGYPHWDTIVITNPGNNTFYEAPIEEWRRVRSENVEFQKAVNQSKKKLVGSKKVAGFDCTRYFLLNRKGQPWCEFYVTGKMKVDKKLETAMSRLAMVPIGYGWPIEMHTLTAKGKPNLVITRVWDLKPTMVKHSEMVPPKGLTRMKRLSDIWLARDGKVEIVDIDDFFEYKFDKKK